ncbi:MAG: mandelate racemase/muconate lactonizing enzyme family protein [Rubrivivax sp.]
MKDADVSPRDLTIAEVEAIPLTARMAAGTRTSQGVYDAVSIVLVKVRTVDGVVGVGECLGRFGARAYAAFIEEVLAPRILGGSAFDIRRHWQAMRSSLSGRAGGMMIEALAGVDIALWDVVGRALGQPVHRLLGGVGRREVDCYASSVNWADTATMQAQARQVVAMGFRTVKVKLGAPVARAIEAATAVREAVGPGVALGVDANWAYSLDEAVAVGHALHDLGYAFFEEPIPPEDLDGYAHLRRVLSVPLAAGESDYTVAHAAELLTARLVALIQPDVARAGGISETRDIATLAQAHHVGYAPHVGWSGAVCVAASLQLAAAMPAFKTFECMFVGNPLRDALTTEPVGSPAQLVDGRLPVPQGPGLGIEIDWDRVDALRIDRVPRQA